jgi:hypothetical protein
MGWNPFKTVKKVVKSIGKGIKKIGKRLKNIVAKIAKPFAKLGIVGQVALGFLMPWAAGAIWTGLTGTTFSLASMGTVAGNLAASTNVFAKAAGYIMKGVHWGATQVKGAFQYVTDKMSQGMDYLTNKAQDMFGKQADAGDLIADAVQNGPDIDPTKIQDTFNLEKNLAQQAQEKGLGVELDTQAAFEAGAPKVPTEKVVEKTFAQQAIEKVKEGALGALATRTEEAFTSTQGEQGGGVLYDLPNFLGDTSTYTKYNQTDLTLQNQGYNYGGAGYQANITGSSFGQDEFYNYFNTMGLGQGAR